MTTKYEAMKDALNAMVAEFRGYDLPYGSKAYAAATTALNMPEDRMACHDAMQLAEMVLSDCGCSTAVSDRLQRRVAVRIQQHIDAVQQSDPLGVPEDMRNEIKWAANVVGNSQSYLNGGARVSTARKNWNRIDRLFERLAALLAADPKPEAQQQDDINVVDLHPEAQQPAQALTDFDIVTMANRIIDYSFICDGGGPTELASDEARQAGLIEFARAIEAKLKGTE